MLDRFFRLSEHQSSVSTEVLAGVTTFLTMAYIIVVQPAVLSGSMFGKSTGMDFGAVTTATCLAAAVATLIMGLYARYPIAQAPGMGENFIFVFSVLPAAATAFPAAIGAGQTTPWQIALGVVFVAGVMFLVLSVLGVRERMLEAISPSMRNGIAIGIGLFIAFIGLKSVGLVEADAATCVKLNPRFASPDVIVFGFALLITASLHARRVRGAIVWGILAATLLSMVLRLVLPTMPAAISDSKVVTDSALMTRFMHSGAPADAAQPMTPSEFQTNLWQTVVRPISLPPSMAPTFLKMDLVRALSWPMVPFILIFLFMDLFDTLGTLIGVSEQAGFMKGNRLPRAGRALTSDAVGTVVGAGMGTSTVTSFIESAAGVEQGGRTGLTAVVVAVLFLVALFFSPVIVMIGSYPPITAAALVVVGSMMMRNVTKIEWSNYAEAMPTFLIILGIPLTYSIADGLALGFIAYPVIKLGAGQHRDVKWLMYLMALVLLGYFLLVHPTY